MVNLLKKDCRASLEGSACLICGIRQFVSLSSRSSWIILVEIRSFESVTPVGRGSSFYPEKPLRVLFSRVSRAPPLSRNSTVGVCTFQRIALSSLSTIFIKTGLRFFFCYGIFLSIGNFTSCSNLLDNYHPCLWICFDGTSFSLSVIIIETGLRLLGIFGFASSGCRSFFSFLPIFSLSLSRFFHFEERRRFLCPRDTAPVDLHIETANTRIRFNNASRRLDLLTSKSRDAVVELFCKFRYFIVPRVGAFNSLLPFALSGRVYGVSRTFDKL